MKRCAKCGGPFGMVRRWSNYVIGWSLVSVQFCSEPCERGYREARERDRRVAAFLRFLGR